MDVEEKLDLMKIMFNPKNVEFVGATDMMIKIGSFLGMSVLASEFKKNIYPLNPNPKYEKRIILGI